VQIHSAVPEILVPSGAARLSSFSYFVPHDLDLWPWHSNASERETKHVFPVHLWIWYKSVQPFPRYLSDKQKKQTKSHRQCQKTEPYLYAVNSNIISLKSLLHQLTEVKHFSFNGQLSLELIKMNTSSQWTTTHKIAFYATRSNCLQCFDTVGCAAGRASGL